MNRLIYVNTNCASCTVLIETSSAFSPYCNETFRLKQRIIERNFNQKHPAKREMKQGYWSIRIVG